VTVLLEEARRPSASVQAVTPLRWSRQVLQLAESKVLAKIASLREALCTSRYFAVPKLAPSGDATARAILDARPANRLCHTPPPLALVEVREQMLALEKIGAKYILLADWRHFFHQIPLGRGIREQSPLPLICRLFALRVSGLGIWRWASLPMGWSWSPYLAQMVSWLTLLIHEEKEAPLFDTSGYEKEDTPRMLKIGEKAVVFVLYDNVLIAAEDHNVFLRIRKRLQRNVKLLNLAVKTWEEFGPGDLSIDAQETEGARRAIHLGLQIGRSADGHWMFRHDPVKVARWEPRFSRPNTLRGTARLLGTIVRHLMVNGIRLVDAKQALRLASRIGTDAPKVGWDVPAALSDVEWDCLGPWVTQIRNNSWAQVPDVRDSEAAKQVHLATDASDTGLGAVVMSLKGDILSCLARPDGVWSIPCNAQLRDTHIFFKELTAAVKGATHFADLMDWKDCTLNLYVDNTAAAGALRRAYSSCDAANDLLEELFRVMDKRNIRLNVVSIPGLVNPADGPSRFATPQPERFVLLKKEMDRQEQGRIGATAPWTKDEELVDGGIRHREMACEADLISGLSGRTTRWKGDWTPSDDHKRRHERE